MLFDFKSKVYFTGLNKISKKKKQKTKQKRINTMTVVVSTNGQLGASQPTFAY